MATAHAPLYRDFVGLHDKSDDDVRAFITKHGPLGLNPTDTPSWDYRDTFVMRSGEREESPDWTLWEDNWFVPWENVKPVSASAVEFIEETPELVRQEAQKMFRVIFLWQMIKKCIDPKNGELNWRMILPKKVEVEGLCYLLLDSWPNAFETFYIDLDPVPSPLSLGEKVMQHVPTVIRLPDFGKFFDNILLRVRYRVVRESSSKNPFGFDIRKGHLEFVEGCLLARLWHAVILDMVEGSTVPQFCKWCRQLYFSNRASGQDYCSASCQQAAAQWRYRTKKSETEGRVLRPTRGRPPKLQNDTDR